METPELKKTLEMSRLMVLISSSTLTLLDLIKNDPELVAEISDATISFRNFTNIIDRRIDGNN